MNIAGGGCPGAANSGAASAYDEWVAAMRAGDFDVAWAIADRDIAMFSRSGFGKQGAPRYQQRIWCGEKLQGKKVLIRCYHGLGDTIQFIRFAAPLRRIAREVIVWCQPALVPLVARVNGVDQVLPLHEGSPDIDFDVDIEIMEIPHAIRAQREQIEMREPYLTVSPSSPEPRLQCAGALAVGLVWEAGAWDKRRSIPLAELRRLKATGVQPYCLQRGVSATDVAAIGATDISVADLESLASCLYALDLLICPDTMIAHLSAALGRETWILLHSACDWRWPSSASTSLWYPSARLFHQPGPGDWGSVMEEVRLALDARASAHRRSVRPCHAGRTTSSGTDVFSG